MNVTYRGEFPVIHTTEPVLLTWMCTEMIAAGIQIESEETLYACSVAFRSPFADRQVPRLSVRCLVNDLERSEHSKQHSIEFINPLDERMSFRTCHLMWVGKTALYPKLFLPRFRIDEFMVQLFSAYGVPPGSESVIAFVVNFRAVCEFRLLFREYRRISYSKSKLQVQTPIMAYCLKNPANSVKLIAYLPGEHYASSRSRAAVSQR